MKGLVDNMIDGYLIHHGIKGQRWGIRRYQNDDGTLTNAGRARYYKERVRELKKEYRSKIGSNYNKNDEEKYVKKHYGESYKKDQEASNYIKRQNVAAGAVAATAALVTLGVAHESVMIAAQIKGQNELEKIVSRQKFMQYTLDDITQDDQIIPEGHTIKRTTFNKDEKENESFYVTSDKNDSKMYKNYLGKMGDFTGTASRFESTYKTNKEIKVPSDKKAMEIYVDTLRKNGKDTEADYLDSNPKILADRYYKANQGIVAKDHNGNIKDPILKEFSNNLKKSGYNGLSDLNDRNKFSGNPVVLLDASKDLDKQKTRKVGNLERAISMLAAPKINSYYEDNKKIYK